MKEHEGISKLKKQKQNWDGTLATTLNTTPAQHPYISIDSSCLAFYSFYTYVRLLYGSG